VPLSSRSWIVAAVLVAAIAAGGLAGVARFGESAGSERGVTLRDVVEDPARYVGSSVTVSGEIAENDYASPADARIAFVLGDDADLNLLVLPRAAAAVPRDLTEDTVLRVRGTVGHAPAELDAQGRLSPMSRLITVSDARAVLRADRVELLNPRRIVDRPSPPFPHASVSEILNDPAAVKGPVAVSGTAHHVAASGFVLSASGESIYVGAPAVALRALTEGERVSVRADVERLSPFRADRIAGRAGSAPSAPGDPLLVLRSISP